MAAIPPGGPVIPPIIPPAVGGGGAGGALPMIEQCLQWIAFNPGNATLIANDIGTLQDLASYQEDDIDSLESHWSKRTPANTRIFFGVRRIKYLKSMIYWCKDFQRVSEAISINGLDDFSFRAALDVARDREEIRKEEAKRGETMASASPPPKLTSEAIWTDWKKAMTTFLTCVYGALGIPLIYVLREVATPTPQGHPDFLSKCIACAPLTGNKFTSDARRVHQFIQISCQGQISEPFIKPLLRYANGRRDMEALEAHYEGQGNRTRRIHVAERMRDSLHYRSERVFPFSTFLSRLADMFNIFDEQGEPYTADAQLRFLLDKTVHPGLKACISSLRVQITTQPGTVTFATAANHIAAIVTTLPDYKALNRKIGAIGSGSSAAGGSGESYGGTDIVYIDGKMWTGRYQDWNAMSSDVRNKITNERKRTGKYGDEPYRQGRGGRGARGGRRGGRGGGRGGRGAGKRAIKSLSKKLEDQAETMAQMQEALENSNAVVATLKSGREEPTVTPTKQTSFGGRAEKKLKKGNA